MKKKSYNIILIVLSIGSVLMVAVSLTFAYFSAVMSGTAASATATTAKIGTVTFDGGADFVTASQIEPDWSESKTFTISVAPSDISQTVYVKMTYTNNMPDLTCNVIPVDSGAAGSIELNTTGEDTTVTLVEKTFAPSDSTQTITYTLTMALPETGKNQDASQGKSFTATLFADLGTDNIYYNNANPNGINTPPSAD